MENINSLSETSRLELLIKVQYYIRFMISKKNIDKVNDKENKFLLYLSERNIKVKTDNDIQFKNYLMTGKKEFVRVFNVIYLFSIMKLMNISKSSNFKTNVENYIQENLQINDIDNKNLEETINNIKKKKNIQRQKSASKMSDEEKALHEHHRSLGLGNVFSAMGEDGDIDINEEMIEDSDEKLINEDYLDSNLDK